MPNTNVFLTSYITAFHNFAHASHVIMSCAKLMKRIVNPTDGMSQKQFKDPIDEQVSLYKSTYGISGYPLMLFAATFSALIHDVDHTVCLLAVSSVQIKLNRLFSTGTIKCRTHQNGGQGSETLPRQICRRTEQYRLSVDASDGGSVPSFA